MNNTEDKSFFCDLHVKQSKRLSPELMIRALLKERNWKQSELAQKIGMTRQALNNYLRGFWVFPLSIKIKIAEAFGVDSSVIWRFE